jgi:tetratricopeptide (TPR) repeat protein
MKWTWALAFIVAVTGATAHAQTMNMQEVAQALGVRCEYCHSAPRGSGQAEPKKDIALAMMAMTRDLNAKVQAATGKPPNETTRVECATCHRGVAIPQPLSAIILRTVAQKGGAAAVEQYRDLRKQFYSRATYDFSEDALLEMVQRVVQGRPDDAIALLRMNLEFNPQSAKTYALIGFAYTRKIDDASAITNLEKSLELDPTNAMVRGQLEQLQEYLRRRQQQPASAPAPPG